MAAGRPLPEASALGLAQRRAELAEDLAAAQKALPAARALEAEAAARLGAAGRRQMEALAAAAVEAAQEMLPGLRSAIARVLRIEAELVGIELALRERGNAPRAPSAFLHCASVVADAVKIARREASAPADIAGARRLLDALSRDPTAVFGA
jgi:hypothetical protein